MGLKQLLIILILFGTKNSIYTVIGAFILIVCTFFNLLLRKFWNSENTVVLGILFTGFLSSIILELGKVVNYQWASDNKIFLYTLGVIPIVLLEYRHLSFKPLFKEFMIFIDGFIFIGLLKELIVNGSLFNLVILKNYEGLLIFNNNSGTLLLIGLTMIISEFLREGRKK